MVVSGTAGGDEGVRGFVAAYDQATGKEVWRFWTVPKPGEPGSETWKGKDRSSIRSGATWMTGSYDPQLEPCTGRSAIPVPISMATIARATICTPIRFWRSTPKTGKLKWYYQFTPHDVHDWDAQEPPFWSMPTGRASRASCCCRRIATASSMCSTGPTGSSCWRSRSSRS